MGDELRYIILVAGYDEELQDRTELAKRVRELLDDGWQLAGGVSVTYWSGHGLHFAQAMTKAPEGAANA